MLSQEALSTDFKYIEQIMVDLGLVNYNEERETRGWYYEVLGFFKFQSRIIGVIWAKGSESGSYKLLEIQEQKGRIVLSVYGGGC